MFVNNLVKEKRQFIQTVKAKLQDTDVMTETVSEGGVSAT